MKNFRKLFIAAAILCILAACRSNRDRLMEINTFLNDNRLDTAQFCLTQVTPSDLSVYDEALYNLVTVKLNHLRYHPVPSDTIIRSCVDVFTNFNDKERLAESLYYQAVTYYEEGHVPQAFTAMKKAEAIAQDIDDLTIRHKIIESLTDWNMTEHQYQLAMSYGRRNLALSTMANDSNWIAYAWVFISQVYTGMNQRDSAKHYLDKCVTYMKDVPDSQRVDFYNYIAAVTMKTDLPAAHAYAKKGNDIRENGMGYATIAQISYREGKGVTVDSLIKKALHFAVTPSERIYVLQQAMNIYEAQNRYDQAYQTSLKIMAIKDNESLLRVKHNVQDIQAKYDSQKKDLWFQKLISFVFILVSILLFVGTIIIRYHHKHLNKTTNEAIEDQKLIKSNRQRINELEALNKEKDAEINTLTQKLHRLQKHHAKIYYEGRKFYDHIMNGGTLAQRPDLKLDHFIEYYKLIDLPYVIRIEKEYKNLSSYRKFFLILYHMGKDKTEVRRIVGIADSSVRSNKSRIKSCKI